MRLPICNGISSRAPRMGTFVFPLCYRCFGMVLGLLIPASKGSGVIGFIFLALFLLDVWLQYFRGIESTNIRRFFTGVAFTVGLKMTVGSL